MVAASDLDAALPRLRRYARVLAGALPEADDLLLDTLDHARAAPAPFESLRARLFALMHERYMRREPLSRARPDSASRPSEAAEPAELSGVLADFAQLPVEEREVLLLAAVEQMSYVEIAAVLGVPTGTVAARLKRARERMRALTDAESS
jgi:RNA polymerase sigma-70 factor (ECF subfamily)